jgi:phage terminase large subunit-like protein
MSDWSFACPDWVERLRDGRSLVPQLPLDQVEADRAVKIFDKLRLPDVPGQPTMREAAGDWFRDLIRAGFGSSDPDTGRRRVAEILLEVPKKNSKTTNGAGVMVTAMLMNERPRAEMLLIGPTQEVADLAFQQASGMIDADPYLAKRFQVQEHLKTIVDRRTKAKLKVKTFDMKVMTGSKPVIVLLDELHIMSTFSYASRVLGQIRGGLLANPESLLIMITTQSDQPPAGVFKQELQYARGVRDGRITHRVRQLPILYEFPEEMQTAPDKPWLDPANWPMVLPNLGRSISIERLLDDFAQAKEKGEEEVRRWASQHLNVQIGLALHADRWRGADYWLAAGDPSLTLDALLSRCDVAVVGIDGGGLDDLTGVAVLGRCRTTRRWLLWTHAWVHPDVLQLRKDIVEKLNDLVADGDLTICEFPTQDVREVADLVQQVRDAGLLPEQNGVGVDPVAIAATVDELGQRGIVFPQLVSVGQGYRLASAAWGAERKLKDGTLVHADQPLMAWCVGNAKAVQKGNAVSSTSRRPARRRSTR